MSHGLSRSASKEKYWRGHLDRQSASGCSIRSYCHRHGLSEASFHYWRRREIAGRDSEHTGLPRSNTAGLIAVEIVGESSPLMTTRPMMEIECPGGPVIRVREDVSAEVLQRVIGSCQHLLRGEIADHLASACTTQRRPRC